MADNGTVGSNPTVAWDDIGGIAYQRIKVGHGADGSYTDVSAASGLPTQIVGPVTAAGFLRVESSSVDSPRLTYSATINNTAVAGVVTAAVPNWEIQNPTANTTKLIRVTRVEFMVVAATAGTANMMLVKRAVSTGGTAVVQSAGTGHDSNNPAATAVVNYYTAAPTAGTLSSIIRHNRIWAHATTLTATGSPPPYDYDFGSRPGQSVILRPGQALSLQSSTAYTGVPTITGFVEWTEETI